MRDDCIAIRLGLPELKILRQRELDNCIEVTVIYRRDEVTCPRCGRVTTKVHDRRQQNKQDRMLRDKAVFLTLIKRRFRCLWCSKVFTEPDEIFGSSLLLYIDAASSDLYVIPRYKTAYVNPFSPVPTVDILCSYYTREGIGVRLR